MRTLGFFLLLASWCGLAIACKRSNLQGDERDADAVAVILPQRLADANDERSTSVEIDEKSGRPRSTLVLRLDYFPSPQPGRTTLPACFRTFPADFALGSVRCSTGGTSEEKVLFVKHVDQDCYTDTSSLRKKASQPLLLVGCQLAEVHAYQFDPPIRIDTEVK